MKHILKTNKPPTCCFRAQQKPPRPRVLVDAVKNKLGLLDCSHCPITVMPFYCTLSIHTAEPFDCSLSSTDKVTFDCSIFYVHIQSGTIWLTSLWYFPLCSKNQWEENWRQNDHQKNIFYEYVLFIFMSKETEIRSNCLTANLNFACLALKHLTVELAACL